MPEAKELQGEWPLTPRQMECLKLLWSRNSAKQIARKMEISVDTVDAHLRQCRIKLGTASSMDAAKQVFGDREEITVKPYYNPTGIPGGHHPLQFELTPVADASTRGIAGNVAPINRFGALQTLVIILAVALGSIFAVVLLVEAGQGINRLGASLGF